MRELGLAADQRGCDEQRSRNHENPEQFEHALEERGEESAWGRERIGRLAYALLLGRKRGKRDVPCLSRRLVQYAFSLHSARPSGCLEAQHPSNSGGGPSSWLRLERRPCDGIDRSPRNCSTSWKKLT